VSNVDGQDERNVGFYAIEFFVSNVSEFKIRKEEIYFLNSISDGCEER
jgi:hypothetical protein